MEFKFAVNDIFKNPIVEINHSLIPPGFTGDRRSFWDVVGKVSEVVNAMGEASAAAQGLTKPITTAERLRNSEHKVYLLIDQNAGNGRGAVTGMLKTGKKGLYVFDRNGQHFQVSPPCVLDFYVHESRQRTGLGKRLFEHMLQTENIEPVKMAIDRPSDKFLGFLNKHYTLSNPVKQMNNYVVFDGFFPNTPEKNGTVEPNHSGGSPGIKQSANGLQTTSYMAPLGRYGAHRPPCSMGQIIHNQTSTISKNTEPTGVRSAPVTNYQNAPDMRPGNPAAVTQSTPNMYYRRPEQPNTETVQSLPPTGQITNNEYYQRQQQSNNVWQSVGGISPNSSNVEQNQTKYNMQNPNYYEASQVNPQNMYTNNQQQSQNYVNQLNNEGQSQMLYGNGQQYDQPIPQNYVQQMPNEQQYALQRGIQGVQPVKQSQTQIPNITQSHQVVTSQYESLQPVLQSNPQYAQNSHQQYLQSQQVPQQNIVRQQSLDSTVNTARNQLTIPQQNVMYQHNTDQNQPTMYTNMNIAQNQQVPQQNITYQQNIDKGPQGTTYSNLNVPQTQQVQLEPNLTGYGSSPQMSYSTPQTSIQNTHLMPSQNTQIQPVVTRSVLNTDIPPQYNQPQNLSYDMNNQLPQTTAVAPQYNNQPQTMPTHITQQAPSQVNMFNANETNQPLNIPKATISQTNPNAINEKSMPYQDNNQINTTQSQYPIPEMTNQYIPQHVNHMQPTPSQTNALNQNPMNPEILQHMEGTQLNNTSIKEEKPEANGDMRPLHNPEIMLRYGYPPQSPDILRKSPHTLSIAGR